MKNISNITIKFVKGIRRRSFPLNLEPNKIHLLVAPNGFGKSSFATAFAKMNRNCLKLDKKDCYEENESYIPEVSITFDNQILTADPDQNEIQRQFKIKVIGSGLISRAKRYHLGAVSSTMKVTPIEICTIPTKITFNYAYSLSKNHFGPNGKILPNIKPLFENYNLVQIFDLDNMLKFSQKRNTDKLNQVIDVINQQTGNKEKIVEWIANNDAIDELSNIEPLKNLSGEILKLNLADSKTDAYLKAYQILQVFADDENSFKESIKWLKYINTKERYNELLDYFNSSNWQRAELKEDKKNKKLHIVFPDAHQISNGQRDVVTLIVQICEFLYEVPQKPLILIIDEVFDYLDDANLTAFQHYITKLKRECEKQGQAIYPLVLTHLDPEMFSHFSFNSLKVRVHYLQKGTSNVSQHVRRLIQLRSETEDDNLRDTLEKHWFHYHPETLNAKINASDWPSGIPQKWREAAYFRTHVEKEARKYLDENSSYDVLAVCFAIRLKTEQSVYETLDSNNQTGFLETYKTRNKLQYAAELGNDIHDVYFLLGLIYNTRLHWDHTRDYISPLKGKLNHPVIKNLVRKLMEGNL